MNPRELLQSAQAAEREGDLARAGALLEQAARMYEASGHTARAAQMRRHVARLGVAAKVGARGVEEPTAARVPARSEEAEGLPGLDRALVERTPALADPALEAWCSFCCRPSREVGALVSGPAQAYVCRGCVELAASLLAGAGQVAGEDPPTARPTWPSDSVSGSPSHRPNRTGSSRGLPGSAELVPKALPTQVEAVGRIEAALAAGHARVLLVGAAGSGKTTWLHSWAARGLGTAWDGTDPLPEHGALLVDDVDRLEAGARRQLARVLGSRAVVLSLDATLPEPEQEVGGRRVHASEQVESVAGTWLPGPVLDRLTLECFPAPGEGELRLLAERWRAPDGTPAQPDALEEALRLAVRSGRAAPRAARAAAPMVGLAMSGRTLTVYRLGRVEYEDGLRLQALFARSRKEGRVGDVLLLLEHPPVLTLGRGASRADVLASPEVLEKRGVEVHETDRGGEVTYHGPGQIVGYPILDLAPDRKDVRRHVRSVEEGMIRALAEHGIEAGRIPKWPGVWVGSEAAGDARKIGAVGVHIARSITTHGFALNVNASLEDFELIVPCGIREAGVTSMERELGQPVAIARVEESLARAFGSVLEAELLFDDARIHTVSVTAVRRGPAGPEVLLLRRILERGGFWQPVTGRRLPGESSEAAALRELEEETGARLPVRSLEYRHSFALGDAVPPALVEEEAFAAEWPQGVDVRPGPEHDSAEWVRFDHALTRVPFAGLRRAVRRANGTPGTPIWR